MGLCLIRLTNAKLLFDVRGLMAEEYADAKVWPEGGLLFRITKRAEIALVRACHGLVVLTKRARELLRDWYGPDAVEKPFEVIPCCVDLRAMREPRLIGRSSIAPVLVYTGKLDGWYLTTDMARFVDQARSSLPGLRWRVWTQSDPSLLDREIKSRGLESIVEVGRCSPVDMGDVLRQSDAGLSFIKTCLSKEASSPTKVAEYLAAGLPVVATSGVGDVDSVLLGDSDGSKAVGVVVERLDDDAYADAIRRLRLLLDDPETPSRCQAVARREFDLETIGWVRYRRLYQALLGPPRIEESVSSNATMSENTR
jgi:glycosyltransferase involved in cell wall biosynthesis